MTDDLIHSALTHGGSLLAGGSVSAWVVRFLFSDVAKRLQKIEESLEASGVKADTRHETLIERVVKVESMAQAAHRRIDELPRSRRR